MSDDRRGPEGPPPEAPPPAPPPRALGDVEGGLRHVHLMEMQTKARVAELSATVNAMLETLVGAGHLPLEDYEKRKRLTVLRENDRTRREVGVALGPVPDKYALEDTPVLDCAALLPLCQARCCKLPAALSVQDLDERVLLWDYAHPYVLARRADGYCAHHEGGACSVYARRPAACRAYDCRKDRRIWIDFERRLPAP